MLYDLTDDKEAKKYLDNVEIEYNFNCYHEKDAEGCYRLAEFLLNVRKEYKKSADLFKSTCDDYKHGHSCFRYGNNKILGKGCDKDMAKAFEYHKKGCDHGYTSSCLNVGLCNLNGKGDGKVDVKSALSYFTQACDKKDADGCHQISAIYIKGKGGIEKNMGEAFKYALRSCDMGNMYACANVSQMYKKGEGVTKDEKRAARYKYIAENLYKENKKIKEAITFNR